MCETHEDRRILCLSASVAILYLRCMRVCGSGMESLVREFWRPISVDIGGLHSDAAECILESALVRSCERCENSDVGGY